MTSPTEEQRAAIESAAPHRVVIACPGTGKTFTVVRVIEDLILRRGRSPHCIVAVTFTRQAAGELRERVEKLIGRASQGVQFGTSTALALAIVRSYPHIHKLPPDLTVYDDADERDVMSALISATGTSGVSVSAALEAAHGDPSDTLDAKTERLVTGYFRRLREHGAVAMRELFRRAVETLEADAHALSKWSYRCRYLIVDEYQDTAPDEDALYRALQPRTTVVVGDPNQELYGFRGTSRQFLLDRIAQDDAEVFNLTRSFRSSSAVCRAANNLISNNPDHGAPIVPATKGGAVFVVSELDDARAIRATCRVNAAKGSVALLSRTNRRLDAAVRVLTDAQIPIARLSSPTRLWRTSEVRAFHGAIRATFNPHDMIAVVALCAEWPGMPRPGSQEWFAARRRANADDSPIAEAVGWSAPEGDLKELAEWAARRLVAHYNETERTSRAENVHRAWSDVHRWTEANGASLRDFVDHLTIREIRDCRVTDSEDAGVVHVGTIHAAKGLEFDSVVIVGAEEDHLPSRNAALDEERRVAYVGVTRARSEVTCIVCEERGEASSFLAEMEGREA